MSGNQGYTEANVFSDNDALASIVAAQLGAEVGSQFPGTSRQIDLSRG